MLVYIPTLQEEIENLKSELKSVTEELDTYAEDSAILKDLHRRGYIDADGNPTK